MKHSRFLSIALLLLAVAAPAALLAVDDIPLTNWTVPPYHGQSAGGGLTTMTDITFGIAFVAVAPCRLLDTRGNGFSGAYGPPSLAGGVPRNFDLNSDPNCPGIPAGVGAYSLNVTVTNTQGPGFILIYPQGGAQPTVSTVNYVAGQTIANAAIVPAGTGGGVTVIAGVSGTDLIIDINGYFTGTFNEDSNFFSIVSNYDGGGVGFFWNQATTNNSAGIHARVGSAIPDNQCCGPTAVIGRGAFNGVAGVAQDRGTVGLVLNGAGNLLAEGQLGRIGGSATQAFAVNGFTVAGVTADDSAAVKGDAFATTGRVYGIRGYSASTNSAAAGVMGFASSGFPAGGGATLATRDDSGVIGTGGSGSVGVQGIVSDPASSEGVRGAMYSTGGVFQTEAFLGYSTTTAIFASGNISKTGSVSFVEPHSSDPTKMVKYVSLEGNEAGTYFRGRAKFQNGIATIDVPEDFRIVTQPQGLSIQVTPIGEMASVAVASIGLDRIVVRGSRNVEFFYTVNGIRRGYADFQPILDMDKTYIPDSPDAVMPEAWNGEIRNRLIAVGIYRPDGKVNMETAERVGWTRKWEAEKRVPARQPDSPQE